MAFFKGIECFQHNGFVLVIKNLWRQIINKVFNFALIWGRLDLKIDSSAKILGLSHIKIGKNFSAGKFLWLEAVLAHGGKQYNPLIVIKDNVSFNDFVHVGATNYVEIGNDVLLASHIYISDHNHGSYSGKNQSDPNVAPNRRVVNNDKKTVVEDNAWIGERVCILPGVRIGKGSIIGAGSVVTKDIPDNCIAVGNPARVVKKYNFVRRQWI